MKFKRDKILKLYSQFQKKISNFHKPSSCFTANFIKIRSLSNMKLHKIHLSKFSFICQKCNQSHKVSILNQVGNSVVGKKISKAANVFVETQ